MAGETQDCSISVCHIVMTCHFLQSGPPSDRLQSVYLQVTSLQHDSILAVADSTSIHLQTVSQMLHPAEGCMYSVQNPREGSLSLAWDSSGSLLAVCTAMGRLRLYHDQGRHCTLLDLAEHVLEVVFTPGDPSMMYCIRSRGISLLNLKALPECAAFCQAGSGYQAAVLCDPGCVGPTGCEDPIARQEQHHALVRLMAAAGSRQGHQLAASGLRLMRLSAHSIHIHNFATKLPHQAAHIPRCTLTAPTVSLWHAHCHYVLLRYQSLTHLVTQQYPWGVLGLQTTSNTAMANQLCHCKTSNSPMAAARGRGQQATAVGQVQSRSRRPTMPGCKEQMRPPQQHHTIRAAKLTRAAHYGATWRLSR
ncbi:TPA: hypothetical protein ACH3X2_14308 [Trebouxia sp. C0005]